MTNTAQAVDSNQQPREEDVVRANTYGLLAFLLASSPDESTLSQLRELTLAKKDGQPAIVEAWDMLKRAAERAEAESVEHEYFNLFIGIGRGELVPYASWYMTGFLMEKPLAQLRGDLEALGFERQEDVNEPEDHAAALCEVMNMLISDPGVDFEIQQRFFNDHMAPWMDRLFQDMQRADAANFYCAVGQLGEAFMEIEKRYLSMMV